MAFLRELRARYLCNLRIRSGSAFEKLVRFVGPSSDKTSAFSALFWLQDSRYDRNSFSGAGHALATVHFR